MLIQPGILIRMIGRISSIIDIVEPEGGGVILRESLSQIYSPDERIKDWGSEDRYIPNITKPEILNQDIINSLFVYALMQKETAIPLTRYILLNTVKCFFANSLPAMKAFANAPMSAAIRHELEEYPKSKRIDAFRALTHPLNPIIPIPASLKTISAAPLPALEVFSQKDDNLIADVAHAVLHGSAPC